MSTITRISKTTKATDHRSGCSVYIDPDHACATGQQALCEVAIKDIGADTTCKSRALDVHQCVGSPHRLQPTTRVLTTPHLMSRCRLLRRILTVGVGIKAKHVVSVCYTETHMVALRPLKIVPH